MEVRIRKSISDFSDIRQASRYIAMKIMETGLQEDLVYFENGDGAARLYENVTVTVYIARDMADAVKNVFARILKSGKHRLVYTA